MRIKASELKENDRFKFTYRQRKWRIFKKSVLLGKEGLPKEHQGKLLVIYNGCKQSVLSESDTVVIENQ